MSDSTSDHRRHANDEPALVRIEDVHRRYPTGVEALRGVSLTAHEGEVVCIIGPSGSGKSTLLRCINGLEPIDRGRILFDGQQVRVKGRGAREIRRHIGMVFQSFELFPHMTALSNVCEGPRTVLRLPRYRGHGAGARIPCQGRPCGQGALVAGAAIRRAAAARRDRSRARHAAARDAVRRGNIGA